MEERGNKTIMCSVLFLDIVEYSKMSVAGQISLKERFNSYLSAAISNVPVADRIILDTGDGAAINFLGDVEDALKAALSLRESMLSEDPGIDPPLLVRVGLNLGPVRLVRDINGQPNIVGDGINVAQRIMGFAEPAQILVSRSYYDAVSRLSSQYAGIFHYQGSRTDKHVREHEVYAIGYPGDKAQQAVPAGEPAIQKPAWRTRLNVAAVEGMVGRFRQASPGQRALYVGVIALPVVLISVLVLKPARNDRTPVLPEAEQMQAASGVQPTVAAAPAAHVVPPAESKGAEADSARADAAVKADTKKTAESKPATKKITESKPDAKKAAEGKPDSRKTETQARHPVAQPKSTEPLFKGILSGTDSGAEHVADGFISIRCPDGTQMFVDGAEKGKVTGGSLTVAVQAGKHKVIVTSKSGSLYTQNVELEPGKTMQIRPNFCD